MRWTWPWAAGRAHDYAERLCGVSGRLVGRTWAKGCGATWLKRLLLRVPGSDWEVWWRTGARQFGGCPGAWVIGRKVGAFSCCDSGCWELRSVFFGVCNRELVVLSSRCCVDVFFFFFCSFKAPQWGICWPKVGRLWITKQGILSLGSEFWWCLDDGSPAGLWCCVVEVFFLVQGWWLQWKQFDFA